MATKNDYSVDPTPHPKSDDGHSPPPEYANAVVQDENTYQYSESRKIGVTGAVFLILNKMIGTGIFSTPSGIFAATGSVGVSLFLWVIGKSDILVHVGISVTNQVQAVFLPLLVSPSSSNSGLLSLAQAVRKIT
jgi:hypothetical protein